MTTAASMLAAVVIVSAVIGTTGTYASWSDSIEVPPAEFSSGTSDFEITPIELMPSEPLFPGRTTRQPVVVANTGDVDLDLATGSSSNPWISAELHGAPCGSPDQTPSMVNLGGASEMCLETRLSPETPAELQDSILAADITIEGRFGSWMSTETLQSTMVTDQIKVAPEIAEPNFPFFPEARIAVTNDSAQAVTSLIHLAWDDPTLTPTIELATSDCRGLAPQVVESSRVTVDLEVMQPGETKYLCLSSGRTEQELAWVSADIVATYPGSSWTWTHHTPQFRF